MDYKHYLVKAQEADALADAALSPITRNMWEKIAQEYRRAAHLLAEQIKKQSERDVTPKRRSEST
jgi:hypothetical protein